MMSGPSSGSAPHVSRSGIRTTAGSHVRPRSPQQADMSAAAFHEGIEVVSYAVGRDTERGCW
jgi:hypothetical protein